MYTGTVDLDAFEQLLPHLTPPVCYNGDIDSVQFFSALRKRFPALRRFMIGRGLLANPLLAEQIRGLVDPADDFSTRLWDFHDDLLDEYCRNLDGDRPVLGKMKEFWTYFQHSFPDGARWFKKIKKSSSIAAYRRCLEGVRG
jgi:tRNA-dihydrouridine synthase